MQQDITFTITIEAQQMLVRYRPRRFADYGHFEFMSMHNAPHRIIVSETGYLSHFSPMHEIEAVPSVEEYAYMLVLALLSGKSNPDDSEEDEEKSQLALF